MRGWMRLLPVGLALAMSGCDDGGDDAEADAGAAAANLYYDGAESAQLGADGNEARCATCHSNDGTAMSGATLMDIAYRTSFKGGTAATLLDATNACVTGWMGGTALTADDAAWAELEGYMQSISDQAVTEPNPLSPEVLENEAAYAAKYAGGDAAAGAAAYTEMCGLCHDTMLTVNNFPSYNLTTLAAFSEGRIAQKVRTAGPPPSGTADAMDTTSGPMPFFEPSDLSDDDLRNIIAHIKSQGS